jgi:uncharacterized protein
MLRRIAFSLVLSCSALLSSVSAQAQQFNVLLFTKMNGWHHESVNEGVDAMRALAVRHHFSIDWQEDASVFNDEKLKNYQAVIFFTNDGRYSQ